MLLTCPECQVDCTIDEQSAETANCPACGLLLYSRSGRAGPVAVKAEGELERTIQWQAVVDELLPTPEELPKRLGQYELTKLLGQGSFAQVYLASDLELNREVALKIPRKSRFNSAEQLKRFLEEARLAAKLEHPGIVRVYAIGWLTKDVCFIAMELCSGGTLESWLKSERPSRTRTVELMADVAEAVHFAHLNQMVHRDLKPSNVMLGKDGRPRIVDFGLALLDEHQADRAGEIAGTLPYMSPEQVRGKSHHLDGRTDIWSLGIMLYEMLTGQRPFKGNRQQLTDQILNRNPRPLRQIDDSIPADLETVVLTCLGKSPTDRYATARDLCEALRHQQKLLPTDSSPLPRPETKDRSPIRNSLWLSASAVLVALIGFVSWAFFWQQHTWSITVWLSDRPPLGRFPTSSVLVRSSR